MNDDYLAYKKNKLEREAGERKISKRKVAFIFLITFCAFFLLVIHAITKYGGKIDIEYGRAIQPNDGLPDMDGPFVKGSNPISDVIDDRKTLIDSRLKVLQLEETAPSEARIIGKNVEKTVLDMEHYRKLIEEEKHRSEIKTAQNQPPPQSEVPKPPKIVMSKVLIGHYNNFEDARYAQNQLKETSGAVTFIRKMGEIYALQVGSYSDEAVAQTMVNKYSALNYPVWVLQD